MTYIWIRNLDLNKQKKKQEAKSETTETKVLRRIRVEGYTRKGQTRNTKIAEELNICNLNNKILKSRSE
jgi:hypothetical protein